VLPRQPQTHRRRPTPGAEGRHGTGHQYHPQTQHGCRPQA
jgi:hypothetical protein